MQPISSFAQEIVVYCNDQGKEVFIPKDKEGLIDPWQYFDVNNIVAHTRGYIDHYLDFVDLLCQDEFIEELSEIEFNRIIDFIIEIARFSIPKSRPDLKEQLEQDIQKLLDSLENEDFEEEDASLSVLLGQEYSIVPAINSEDPEFLLCKNWFKKKFKQAKNWVVEHKEPLIVGGVVATAMRVAFFTGGVGESAAVAIGGGLVGACNEPPERVNKPGDVRFREDEISSPHPEYHPDLYTHQAPPIGSFSPSLSLSMQQANESRVDLGIDHQIESVKEELVQSDASKRGLFEQVKDVSKDMVRQLLRISREE